ncbi:lysine transporter LysE [Streptomyces sp. Alain-F2R5]|nr:LysE family translocator [Streptomyces sp. Alain-F2R5]PAN00269.1 lysine transporter LysE [Streptomyces sp. Alain-F2R5]
MSLAFLLTTLVVVATPGTGVVYTLAAALSRGRRASVVAALGCALGIVPHLLATVTGVAAVLHASATAFQVLKYAGVAYLLYMAWATLRDKEALVVAGEDAAAGPVPAGRVILRGVLINILNPKLTLFFFAFLPQFVDPGQAGALPRMLLLGGVIMLVTFVVFAGYGVLAASVRNHVISRPRVMAWLRRSFAGSFVALGAKLAFTAR